MIETLAAKTPAQLIVRDVREGSRVSDRFTFESMPICCTRSGPARSLAERLGTSPFIRLQNDRGHGARSGVQWAIREQHRPKGGPSVVFPGFADIGKGSAKGELDVDRGWGYGPTLT
jgi:hypothetical protein